MHNLSQNVVEGAFVAVYSATPLAEPPRHELVVTLAAGASTTFASCCAHRWYGIDEVKGTTIVY